MEPFTGNFFYGEPLPGFKNTGKTEERIAYLPDSDAVTLSGCETTAESVTTAPTVMDHPEEFVRNPLFECTDADCIISENMSGLTTPPDSQFKSTSCSELRDTVFDNKETEAVISTILKDYQKIMSEWNHTIKDNCSSGSNSSKKSMFLGSNNFHSLNSTSSCLKQSKFLKSSKNYHHYSYAYGSEFNKKHDDIKNLRKTQSLHRNQMFNNPKSERSKTLHSLKQKTQFWKSKRGMSLSEECKCLEKIYKDYDRRLQQWCDTVSQCSSLLTSANSVIN